jgi:hypothetical protein
VGAGWGGHQHSCSVYTFPSQTAASSVGGGVGQEGDGWEGLGLGRLVAMWGRLPGEGVRHSSVIGVGSIVPVVGGCS